MMFPLKIAIPDGRCTPCSEVFEQIIATPFDLIDDGY